jgi:uncharacterized protein YjdB
VAFIVALIAAPQMSFAAPKFMATTPTASQKTIYVKKGASIKVTGRYLAKGDKVKSYASSKKTVATISSKGKLKAKKVGTTTITIKTKKGKKDTIKVKVVNKTKKAKKVKLPKTKTMRVKKVARLSVSVSPASATSTVKWTSSNKKVATVDAAGYITTKKVGKTTITVKTSNGKKAKCVLTVTPRVKSTDISVLPEKKTIYLSQALQMSATLISEDPEVPSNDIITWSSSDKAIATVSETGEVTAVGAGKVKITAKAESGKKASAEITVRSIKAKQSNVRIAPGVRYKPGFTLYGLGDAPAIKYSSSDKSIATVSSDGYVQANFRDKATGEVATGTVTIKAKTPAGDSASMKVTVVNEPNIVDLSKWQGNIDWAEASQAIDLAILRVAYGADPSYEPKYDSYADSCLAYGVPFGVYSFALYKTKAEAEEEAEVLYEEATENGRAPLFFVVDVEKSNIKRAHTEAYIAKLRELAEADGILRLKVGVYIGHNLYKKLNLNLSTDIENPKTPDFVWIPRYNLPNNGSIPPEAKRPDHVCDLWQYSSGAYIPGIKGKVDVNTLYDATETVLTEKANFNFAWLVAGPEAYVVEAARKK